MEFEAQLVELEGPTRGKIHAIAEGEHVLGRGIEAEIRLEDKDVSRQHLRVVVGPSGIMLHDLGSKNGVYVAGKRLEQPTLLGHGDTFQVGATVLELVHPASQLHRVLLRAGETTVTRLKRTPPPEAAAPSLLVPLLGLVVFAALLVLLLLS